MSKAVQLVGFSKSGKTELALALASELAGQGFRLAYLKHSGHERAHVGGTDTGKLLAHCQVAAGLFGQETALFWPGRLSVSALLPMLSADVLLIEGAKSRAYAPRVVVARKPLSAAELDALAGPFAGSVLGCYGARQPGMTHFENPGDLAAAILVQGLLAPGLDCGSCGQPTCADLLAKARQDPSAACVVLQDGPATVEIDGLSVSLNPFVARIVAATVRGLVSELKGAGSGEITVRVPAGPQA